MAQSKAARNRSMQKMRKTNYFNIVVVVCKTRSPASCRLVFEYLETKWLECTKKERLLKTKIHMFSLPSTKLVFFPGVLSNPETALPLTSDSCLMLGT